MIVVLNGANQYKKIINTYPQNESVLIDSYPNNYLSFIPKGVTYTANNNDIIINNSDNSVPCHCKTEELTLVLYEKYNKIGLHYGNQLLALYPVATGKQPLPFKETFVTERVVNPNGGNGVLGTRGLALNDFGVAIHGTSSPNDIGKKVSHGCIRMKNEDIEILYPYIAKGTKLLVVQSEPNTEEAIYKNGLPKLLNDPNQAKIIYANEENPNKVYHWKN